MTDKMNIELILQASGKDKVKLNDKTQLEADSLKTIHETKSTMPLIMPREALTTQWSTKKAMALTAITQNLQPSQDSYR